MKKNISYGFLIWLIPFLIAFFIFPIYESNRPLFDTTMAVMLVASTLFFAQKFFRTLDRDRNFTREGLSIGALWLMINLVLDALVFLAPTPLQMSVMEYISDIGLGYVIIPLITVTMGSMILERNTDHSQN